jgi:hypothetical protein
MNKKRLNSDSLAEEMGAVAAFARSGREAETSKPVRQNTRKQVNQQTGLPANQQLGTHFRHQPTPTLKKYSSYLRDDSIKALKLAALEEDRKDYELLQEAVDRYLENRGRRS